MNNPATTDLVISTATSYGDTVGIVVTDDAGVSATFTVTRGHLDDDSVRGMASAGAEHVAGLVRLETAHHGRTFEGVRVSNTGVRLDG